MPKFKGFPIRSTRGEIIFSVSGWVSRTDVGNGGGLVVQVLFPNEVVPQNGHLYLRPEDFKLIVSRRTYRFMHKEGTITLVPPSNGGGEIRLEKRSVELVLDLEAQWKEVQEYNMNERPALQEEKPAPPAAPRMHLLPAPSAEDAHVKSVAEHGTH